MKLGDLIIAVIWVCFLATAFYGGFESGHVVNLLSVTPPPPPTFAWAFGLFIFTFFAIVGFFHRGPLLFGAWGQTWVDRKWGAGTYVAAIMRLRPVALFMLTVLIRGVTSLLSNYANPQSLWTVADGVFPLAFGLGLLVAYLLSLRFPPRMY
jgi:hypothetical protein